MGGKTLSILYIQAKGQRSSFTSCRSLHDRSGRSAVLAVTWRFEVPHVTDAQCHSTTAASTGRTQTDPCARSGLNAKELLRRKERTYSNVENDHDHDGVHGPCGLRSPAVARLGQTGHHTSNRHGPGDEHLDHMDKRWRNVTHTPIGGLSCTSAWLTGKVTANSTAAGFEADITAGTFAGTGGKQAAEPDSECTGASFVFAITPIVSAAAPWCLEATENNDTFKVRGGSCTATAKALEFVMTATIFGSPVTCKYVRASSTPVTGTFQTHPTGDAVFTFGNPVFSIAAGESGFCPSTYELTMSFTASTDTAAEETLFIST
jgi:hypothetical protein